MTELDLGLKVQARELLWHMGFTTRIDVPLGTLTPRSRSKSGSNKIQSFTDLDVLGINLVGGVLPHATVVDCKTSSKRVTERVFWVRGVADLFGADDAWLVREREIPLVARQLCNRLGVAAMTQSDLKRLIQYHPDSTPYGTSGLARLFKVDEVYQALHAFDSLDKKLDQLVNFRRLGFFVNENHENLIQTVSHLHAAKPKMDPANPVLCALFFDVLWLYLLTIARAVLYVRQSHGDDVDAGLSEYMTGGQAGLREKQALAKMLAEFAPEGAAAPSALPPYFASLRELVLRFLRRPAAMLTAMRYAEVATATLSARMRTSTATAFGETFDPLAAKLAADCAGFLVSAAGLNAEFRVLARAVLMGEAEPASTGGPAWAGEPPAADQDAKLANRAGFPSTAEEAEPSKAAGGPVSDHGGAEQDALPVADESL